MDSVFTRTSKIPAHIFLKGKVMKETVNSWIIRDDKNTIHNLRRRNKEGVIKHDVGRFHVYVCKKCNRVYEQNPFLNEGARVYYYKDFPTYKLERRTCDSCNGHT